MSPFAEALRSVRFEHGLRQKELADLLGCDRSYLSALENDGRPRPTHAFVETLIRVLGLAPEAAEELRRAHARSRRTYAVSGELAAQTYEFLHELFQRLERLNARQVSALHAVLEITDPVRPRTGANSAARRVGTALREEEGTM